jgi:hypothetical protein
VVPLDVAQDKLPQNVVDEINSAIVSTRDAAQNSTDPEAIRAKVCRKLNVFMAYGVIVAWRCHTDSMSQCGPVLVHPDQSHLREQFSAGYLSNGSTPMACVFGAAGQ